MLNQFSRTQLLYGKEAMDKLNPLVLGAHYCGAAEISVPRMLLKGDLLLK